MLCARGQILCCYRMTDAVECLETYNEQSASLLWALPLGMRFRNLAYSEQACPSQQKSPLKWCKSTVRQESPAQSTSDKVHVTFLHLVSDSAAANFFLPVMFNMTGVTGVLAVSSSIFSCTARLAIRPTQPPHIPRYVTVALLTREMHGGA